MKRDSERTFDLKFNGGLAVGWLAITVMCGMGAYRSEVEANRAERVAQAYAAEGYPQQAAEMNGQAAVDERIRNLELVVTASGLATSGLFGAAAVAAGRREEQEAAQPQSPEPTPEA